MLRAGLRPPRHRHLSAAIGLAPTFLALHRPYRGLLWKEMKRITYLSTMCRLLEDPQGSGTGVVVLDEGPVYMLARLLVYGDDRIRSVAFERWWRDAIEQWATTLDMVVWLDAPDPVLTHRLRTRQQSHPVRGLPDEAITEFLSSYRTAYNRVIGALTGARGPTLLSVRTDREPLGNVVQRVAAEIELRRQQGRCA